jgi:hypothetical protein
MLIVLLSLSLAYTPPALLPVQTAEPPLASAERRYPRLPSSEECKVLYDDINEEMSFVNCRLKKPCASGWQVDRLLEYRGQLELMQKATYNAWWLNDPPTCLHLLVVYEESLLLMGIDPAMLVR